MNTPTLDDPSQGIPVELRVLHGPQAGSRLTLMPQETYLLGNGDACTVMLAGAQIQPEHARLTVYADHWTAEPDQGSVITLDGQACGADHPLEFGTVVQLGLVKLTVEQEDAAWTQDEALEPPPKPEPLTDAADNEPSPSPPAQEPTEEAHNSVLAARRAARSPRAPVVALLACMAGGAIALTAYAGWQMTAPTHTPETIVETGGAAAGQAPKPSPSAALQAWLEPMQRLGRLSLEGGGEGPWRVVGHVSSAAERERLIRSAQALPWPVNVDVLFNTERQSQVQRFLASQSGQQLSARVTGNQGAALQVRVLARTQGDADRLMSQLREAHAQLEPFSFEVLLPSDIRQRFFDGLQVNGMADRFEVLRKEPELALRASLPQKQVGTWERYFSQFTAEHGSVLPISATVRTERDSIETRIRAVVAGNYPYVITSTGERVAPGGQIDGKVLITIGAQELVFADGLRVRFQP